MKEYFQRLFTKHPKTRKVIGVLLVLVGISALITPFTPGSWLIFVGLELLGFHFFLWDRMKARFRK